MTPFLYVLFGGFIGGIVSAHIERRKWQSNTGAMIAALEDIRDHCEHDEDAHKYRTGGCHVCIAHKALTGEDPWVK